VVALQLGVQRIQQFACAAFALGGIVVAVEESVLLGKGQPCAAAGRLSTSRRG
jgi:hypothetical protein